MKTTTTTKRIVIALLIALVFCMLFSACNKNDNKVTPSSKQDIVIESYSSGKEITWDVVNEDENGLAYLNVAGEKYELGLDFLANAMVFNSQASNGLSEEEVFAKWYNWYHNRADFLKVYIANPAYGNICYRDVEGIDEYPLDAFHGWEQALHWRPTTDDYLSIYWYGNGRDFWINPYKNYSWRALIVGKGLLSNDEEGRVFFNSDVVESSESIINADGKRQVTVKIRKDMTFSDGTPIKAENYLGKFMVESSPIYSRQSNLSDKLDGYDTFSTAQQQTVFSGVKMLDDYTMVFVYDKEYVNYFWAEELFDLYPYPNEIYLGKNRIVVSEQGVSLPDSAYEKDENGRYVLLNQIYDNLKDPSFASSGPYRVTKGNDDSSTTFVQLAANEDLPVKTIYINPPKTLNRHICVNLNITAEQAEEQGLKMKFFDMSSSSNINMRAVGPLASKKIRMALELCCTSMTFDATYQSYEWDNHTIKLTGFWAGEASLSSPKTNFEEAVKLIEEDGWIYGKDGAPYDSTSGEVRYKKVKELSEAGKLYYENVTQSPTDIRIHEPDKYMWVYLEEEDCYLIPLYLHMYYDHTGVIRSCDYLMYSDVKNTGLHVRIFPTIDLYTDSLLDDDLARSCAYPTSAIRKSFTVDYRGLLLFNDEADKRLVY